MGLSYGAKLDLYRQYHKNRYSANARIYNKGNTT